MTIKRGSFGNYLAAIRSQPTLRVTRYRLNPCQGRAAIQSASGCHSIAPRASADDHADMPDRQIAALGKPGGGARGNDAIAA